MTSDKVNVFRYLLNRENNCIVSYFLLTSIAYPNCQKFQENWKGVPLFAPQWNPGRTANRDILSGYRLWKWGIPPSR